jgi:hypothetical protein
MRYYTIVAIALAETRFNEFRKYPISPEDIRFGLAYPDLSLLMLDIKLKIVSLLLIINITFFS